MPKVERTRSVRIELDRIVGLGELEEAALAFGRSAPAQLVAGGIESMSPTSSMPSYRDRASHELADSFRSQLETCVRVAGIQQEYTARGGRAASYGSERKRRIRSGRRGGE